VDGGIVAVNVTPGNLLRPGTMKPQLGSCQTQNSQKNALGGLNEGFVGRLFSTAWVEGLGATFPSAPTCGSGRQGSEYRHTGLQALMPEAAPPNSLEMAKVW